MRKIIALVTFMVWTLQMSAADGISIANVSIPQGGEAIVEVQLESVQKKYGGFQFDLKLPAGITASTAIVQASRLSDIDGYTLMMNVTDADKNIYTILGYNATHTEIAGNDGVVAYITLQASSGTTVGNVLSANIQDVVISTVTPENIDGANSSFNITIINALQKVTLSETSTTVPAATSNAVDVTVARTIKANEWSTICLPFAMSEAQVKSAFGSDAELAELNSWSFEGTEDNVTSISINFSIVKEIKQHFPYILMVSKDISEFKVYNVKIGTKNKPQKKAFDEGQEYAATMIGIYKAGTKVPENNLFLSNNKFYYSVGNSAIKGFRAYFDLDGIVLNEVNASRVFLSFNDNETTAIKDMRYETKSSYYSISGQQVKNPAKGIYVKDGKKVIIK